MTDKSPNSSTEKYPTFRSGRERFALGLVLLVVLGIPLAIFGYQRLRAAGPMRTIEITARLPTSDLGGWTPEVITVQKGERVRLRLTSADVVHGFAVPKLGIDAGWIEPGKVSEVEFVANRPGRYTTECTVYCEAGHWRMRGIIQVVDPNDPLASEQEIDPPQTDWVASGIDIDAEHPGQNVPATPPDAAKGAQLWQQISQRPASDAARELDLRRTSPSDIYSALSTLRLAEGQALSKLTPAERWDIVALLWEASTTPEARQRGAQLFQRDCTGCHGPAGQGDGPGAATIKQQNDLQGMAGMENMAGMDKPPVDFTDLKAQAGASDLLYYGKLVRGGMGTSMPYWGTIYTEDDLWAVIAHLRSLGFQRLSE